MRNITKGVWIAVGCICLVLGTAGICIPILPTVPLYMATAFCFARGSKKLNARFKESMLYKKHLEPFAENRQLKRRNKIAIMVCLTAVMGVGFAMMDDLVIPRIILACIWGFHLWYFLVKVKTLPACN